MKNFITISSSRAEYGILKILLKKLQNSKNINNKLIVTGAHLSKKFGETYKEIIKDNLNIYKKIPILSGTKNSHDINNTISKTIILFSKLFSKNKPDAIILLGDRYETLAICLSAFISRIPIIHIHGGELSYGSLDDTFRHAISKLSNLHFVSTNAYKKRLIQLGENPKTITNIGSLGIESLRQMKFFKKNFLEKSLKIYFKAKCLIVTIHPLTINKNKNNIFISEILRALIKEKDTTLIFTYPNADEGNELIIKAINSFIKKHPNSYFFKNLGQELYFSLAKFSDGILGNSSSGIIEIPSLNIPTINIGNRQDGRIRSDSVIDCKANNILITRAIKKIYSKNFQIKLKNVKNVYEKSKSSDLLIKFIKNYNFNNNVNKRFYDLNRSNINLINL